MDEKTNDLTQEEYKLCLELLQEEIKQMEKHYTAGRCLRLIKDGFTLTIKVEKI
jgi:hypothetical protein